MNLVSTLSTSTFPLESAVRPLVIPLHIHVVDAMIVRSSTRAATVAAAASRSANHPLAATCSSLQSRSYATVQEGSPQQRRYGGLKDQDRIFQNLYGHHGTDLASAKKYGDWHRTKDIIGKGHDWLINEIKASGLRGRGGAGFPSGLKFVCTHPSPPSASLLIYVSPS